MLIKREMALDQDIGLNGALFGGDMMSHMDQTAGITASLVSYNRRFVTRKVFSTVPSGLEILWNFMPMLPIWEQLQ